MPRYVGSGDYYTFKSIISHTSAGVGIRMPTAPMYKDKETYSGRNRVWLKSVRMGLDDANEWDDNISDSFMEVEMVTASHNVYNGPMGNPDTTIGDAQQFIDADQFTNATFWFAPTLYEYRNDTTSTELVGHTVGIFNVAGAAIATNDTQTTHFNTNGGLLRQNDRGIKADGSNKSIQLHYDNDCYCPAKAVVVGQLWGTELDILINMRPFRDNLQNNRLSHIAQGNIYIEFIVEPLLNEPQPTHMGMMEEKNRMKY